MKRCIFVLLFVFALYAGSASAQGVANHRQWDSHPDVPRITAEEVRELMQRGEKIIFVYAGYEIEETLCNSVYIPYTWVPPFDSGSKVRPRFPKDWWVLAY